MSYRFRLAVMACALLFSACSRIVVEPVTRPAPLKSKEKGAGVFYALPETVIRTQVDVQKTKYSKGKYVKFAPLFAPGHRPVCKDTADCKAKTRFWLKEATLSSFGRPDDSQIFMVKFAGGGAVDQALAMTWTEAGLPVTANATVTNRTTDIVLSGIKLATGVYQRTALQSNLEAFVPWEPKCPVSLPNGDTGSTTDGKSYAVGTKTVNLAAAGTGAFLVGDVFAFAGHSEFYVIMSGDADVSDGGMISFEPGLREEIPSNREPLAKPDDRWILDLITEILSPDGGASVVANYCAMKVDAAGVGKVEGSGMRLTGTGTRFLSVLRPRDEIRVKPSGETCSNAMMSGSTTDGSGYTPGTKTVKLARAGSGALLRGQSFTFTGDPQTYVVTAGNPSVLTGGTIDFEPGLKVAIPASPSPPVALTLLDACTHDRDCVGPGVCQGGGLQVLTVQSIVSDTVLDVFSAISPPIRPGATVVRLGGGPRTRFDPIRDRDDLVDALEAYETRVLPLLRGRAKLIEADQIHVNDAAVYLDRIDSMISKELAALYVGSKKAKTAWTGILDVKPPPPSPPSAPALPTTTPLLRINPAKGICAAALPAPTSKSIPSDITLTGSDCSSAHAVQLMIDYYPDKTSQMFDVVRDSIEDPDGDLSFRYRIPAQVSAQVQDGTAIKHPELIPGQKKPSQEIYGSAVLSVAQLGHVAALPAKRNSKSLTYDLGFIEATGGLKSFKLSSTGALDAAALDSLGTTANSFLDARNAAKAAAAAKTDELTVLEHRAAILKAQSDICTALATFGLPCDVEPELPD